MHRWRIVLSLLAGILAIPCASMAHAVGLIDAGAGLVCWLITLWCILLCMAFAQDDGIYGERRRNRKTASDSL